MARRLKQIAPGLSLVKVNPLWRGDDRVYSFIHVPSGLTLAAGCPPVWRVKRRVAELAEPQLALLDWTNLNPDDPINRAVYRDEFRRIIQESFDKAEENSRNLPRLSALTCRIQMITASMPQTRPVLTGGYEASVQYGDYWRYAVGRTEEEALERLVELVEGGGE